eukprot:GHVL01035996.1.p1 GENE.GHVL01035996.1~~GHVL01035996.1.p1  ORF type:complete len:132 (+),score=24.89 GHVL01035996.1:46-441(+)
MPRNLRYPILLQDLFQPRPNPQICCSEKSDPPCSEKSEIEAKFDFQSLLLKKNRADNCLRQAMVDRIIPVSHCYDSLRDYESYCGAMYGMLDSKNWKNGFETNDDSFKTDSKDTRIDLLKYQNPVSIFEKY